MLEELSERISEIEGRISDLESNVPEELPGVVWEIESAIKYTKATIPDYSDKNVIILHTEGIRTSAIVEACNAPGKCICDMTGNPECFDPTFLSKESNNLFLTTHFVLSSDMFARSAEFEKIIADAITEGKANFAIITDDIEKVPQTLRDIMRLVQ